MVSEAGGGGGGGEGVMQNTEINIDSTVCSVTGGLRNVFVNGLTSPL